MKTLLFFLVIGFSLCTAGKAQTSLVSTREKFRHHEISVSYGFLPITDANSIAEEFIAPTASFGIYTREKTSYYGALNISYIYRINRKISLGVTGGITGNRGTASSLYEVLDENKNDDRRYLYILPTFRWHWFTRPQFSLYSSAGLGAYFLRNSFGGDTYHKKEFAYQFSFLGIESVCLLHRIRRRIYGNNRGRRTFPLLIHEPATASVRILTCTPPTSLSASAHAVVVAPVVSTSSTIRICFPTKRSG